MVIGPFCDYLHKVCLQKFWSILGGQIKFTELLFELVISGAVLPDREGEP